MQSGPRKAEGPLKSVLDSLEALLKPLPPKQPVRVSDSICKESLCLHHYP